MQEAITMPYPVVTAAPVPAICRHCGAVQRPAQKTPMELAGANAGIMWLVAVVAYGAGIMAMLWLASTGVLGWLP